MIFFMRRIEFSNKQKYFDIFIFIRDILDEAYRNSLKAITYKNYIAAFLYY